MRKSMAAIGTALALASCGELLCTPPRNPSGNCESPSDSSRPGYSAAEACTYLRDCQLTLRREYWRVYVHPDDEDRAYLLPRPDGADCLPAGKRQMPAVNQLTPAEALAAARCLHATLRFEASQSGTSFDVAPGRMPDDVAEVCRRQPGLAGTVLATACSDCNVRAILDLSTGACASIYVPLPTQAEAEALAAQLNALYGIAPGIEP